MHFFFSFGAFVAPAAVGEVGYRTIFVSFGVLAIPASLACCLAEGNNSDSGADRAWSSEGTGPGILLVALDRRTRSTDVTSTASGEKMKILGGKLRQRRATVRVQVQRRPTVGVARFEGQDRSDRWSSLSVERSGRMTTFCGCIGFSAYVVRRSVVELCERTS